MSGRYLRQERRPGRQQGHAEPSRKASISRTKPRPLPIAPTPPHAPPCSPPPLEGRREAPVGTPQFPSPLGGRAGQRRRGPRSILRIAATLRIAGRATRGMPRAPDPGARNESARRGRSRGPIGRNGADYALRGSASNTALPCSEPPPAHPRAPSAHSVHVSRGAHAKPIT